MEIKDVIHFYIGQDLFYTIEGHEPNRMKLTGDQLACFYTLADDPEVNYKLILRKLSDMTEDEMKEFKKLIPHIDFVRFERGDKWVYIEHEMDDKHTTRPVCTTTALIGGMPMSVMPYLLKQGFDLFGLIDAGLAIDSKSL